MNRSFPAIALGAALLSISLTSVAQARPWSYSTGFESPLYLNTDPVPTIGTLNGWYREDGSPTATAPPGVSITNTVASSGSQSMRFLNNSPYDQLDAGSVTYSISPIRSSMPGTANMVLAGLPFVHIQWDMRVDDPTDIDDTSDTWCLDVYDGDESDRTLSIARGITNINGPNEPNIYGTDLTGAFDPNELGDAPASGVWGTYEIDMDYTSGTWTFKLNSVLMGGVRPFASGADNGLDVNFTVNGRGIDVAYFDNYSVTATPEPASLCGLLFGGMMMFRRTRRV
ncbi:MAG: hypothetical protein ACREJC_23060 [Tepidisphaeraceae bacterium]